MDAFAEPGRESLFQLRVVLHLHGEALEAGVLLDHLDVPHGQTDLPTRGRALERKGRGKREVETRRLMKRMGMSMTKRMRKQKARMGYGKGYSSCCELHSGATSGVTKFSRKFQSLQRGHTTN